MKKILAIIIFTILCFMISADTLGIELPELLKPDSIFVKNNNLYIIDGDICRIYKLPEGNYVTSFCKSGEGPGEIKTMPGLSAGISVSVDEDLILEGMNKIVFFTEKGNFVKEKRKGGRFFRTNALGNNFAALGITIDKSSGRSFLTLSIFDPAFKLIKELYKLEMKDNDRDIEMVIETIIYSVWRDRIYLVDNKNDNLIIVFDSSGKELYRFKTRIEKVKVDHDFKRKEMNRLKDDDFISMMIKREGGWENFRKKMNFLFPDLLPVIQGITVLHERIHMLTYSGKDDKWKFIITDLKGNNIKTVFLPVPVKSSFLSRMLGRDNKFYSFTKDKYYYLIEDEETESFKIGIIDLNISN